MSHKSGMSKKSAMSKQTKWTAFIEPTFQFGLCGNGNPLGLTAGTEKQIMKHISVSGDVQVWKTNYENWCCDVHSVGKYSTVIPSLKFRFDPGKQNKGFFIGAGIGYAVVRDHGSEEPYTVDPASGTKTNNGAMTPGNWDYNSISPSFQWGFSFKAFKLPVSIVNTAYWGKSTEGWTAVAAGTGLKIGLNKIQEKSSCGEKKASHSNSRKPGCCQKKD